jgi:hypothetical protein
MPRSNESNANAMPKLYAGVRLKLRVRRISLKRDLFSHKGTKQSNDFFFAALCLRFVPLCEIFSRAFRYFVLRPLR